MTQSRNTPLAPVGPPLSARSVLASTLLGMDPPRLETRMLVASGALFGIAEGTTRTAISRMVASGELTPAGDGYALAGHLLDRQARQAESRRPAARQWSGSWELAFVSTERRTATARSDLRRAMGVLHLAEVREGVWTRPDNLDRRRHPEARAVAEVQCDVWKGRPGTEDPAALAASLWDLPTWSSAGADLLGQAESWLPALDDGDVDALAPAFVLSAAVLRHLLSDPLLPADLVPTSWPGDHLRVVYDRFDAAFKQVWRDWYSSMR